MAGSASIQRPSSPRRHWSWLLAVAVVLAALPAQPAFAGRLSGAKSAVRSGSSSRSSSGSSSSSSSSRSSGSRSGSAGWTGGSLGLYDNWWWWLLSPWTLPGHGMADDWERQLAFPAAPYIDGIQGYLRIAGVTPPGPGGSGGHPGDPGQAGRRLLGQASALRLYLEGGAADLSLQRGAVGVLWSGAHRFELGAELRGYQERNPNGSREQLWIGSAAVSVLFAQSEYAQFRTGLGTRWMPGGDQSHRGWHLLYGLAMHLTGRLFAVQGLEGGHLALLGPLVSAHAMTNLWPRGGSDGAQLLALYRAAPKDRRRPPVQRL